MGGSRIVMSRLLRVCLGFLLGHSANGSRSKHIVWIYLACSQLHVLGAPRLNSTSTMRRGRERQCAPCTVVYRTFGSTTAPPAAVRSFQALWNQFCGKRAFALPCRPSLLSSLPESCGTDHIGPDIAPWWSNHDRREHPLRSWTPSSMASPKLLDFVLPLPFPLCKHSQPTRLDCWEMIFAKTSLIKKGGYHSWPCARPLPKTVLSASTHALHVMRSMLQTAGSRKLGQEPNGPSNKIFQILVIVSPTHGQCDCWEMILSKTLSKGPLKENSSECRNSCTSCQAFRGANCKVCFDGAGFLPATLGQNQVVGGAHNRPSKLLNSGHRPNARPHGQCDCWEMILWKTLSKASSKRKTVRSASTHAHHVMHSSLQTAGLVPASKHVLMALASCQQPWAKNQVAEGFQTVLQSC